MDNGSIVLPLAVVCGIMGLIIVALIIYIMVNKLSRTDMHGDTSNYTETSTHLGMQTIPSGSQGQMTLLPSVAPVAPPTHILASAITMRRMSTMECNVMPVTMVTNIATVALPVDKNLPMLTLEVELVHMLTPRDSTQACALGSCSSIITLRSASLLYKGEYVHIKYNK
ncbi:uncharacterized protein LOC125373512 isoform X1 [Haliotis rufescens]|uniref:uncharacterized protein LOC125373512 isoform X1 n=1 Tax=Haliotis rufescens TaxID=6454 RepID=UPI00201F25F2|nr:uncharacterized protein LOC125373512 isoform X1 [Haliotis rufescens]